MDIELNSSTERLGVGKPISSADEANTEASPAGGNSNQKNCLKKCRSEIHSYFHTLLSCILLLAVIALTIVIILHSIKLNRKIQSLENKIESVEAAGIERVAETAALQAERDLEGQIQATQASLVSINASLSKIGAELSAIAANNISELRDQVQDLEASIANSSRFTGCYEDRQHCIIRPVQQDLYYRGCATGSIPANKNVSQQASTLISTCSDYQMHSIHDALLKYLPIGNLADV